MSDYPVVSKKRTGWLAWSTRDILIMAAMGVAFGILLGVLLYPYMLSVALGPIVAWAWVGLYYLPGFFIAYVLRRFGAAFMIAMLYALVMMPFNPYGPMMLISGLLYGSGAELGIAIVTRYRHFNVWTMVLAGIVGSAIIAVVYAIKWPESFNYPIPLVIGIILTNLVSTAIGAFLAKQLADALARTGVLSGTALKSQEKEEI